MSAATVGVGIFVLLGALQGATEFLPVSSHGHLVLVGQWLDLSREGALGREVALHLGTLVAVFIFCRREIASLAGRTSPGLWKLVIACTLVTAAVALPSEEFIEARLASTGWVAAGLGFNALLLIVLAPRNDEGQLRALSSAGWRDGLLLGLMQSLALVPSVSRSACTIVCALWLGYTRAEAIRVAFLVSIPAVGGAILLKLLGPGGEAVLAEPGLSAGLLASLVVGLLALRFLVGHSDARSLRGFGLYCLLLGLVVILVG
ncbi:MAG: undecaprenyl-diphosphate phosphatase [Planctomycetota bacterium]